MPLTYIVEDRGYKTPCHIWQGVPTKWGYGKQSINGKTRRVHIVEWEKVNGPVPKGLELDHLCRVRICCNPQHLEAVTRRTNLMRGEGLKLLPLWQLSKTHCPQGHPYSEENTYRPNSGGRSCRTCKREWQRKYYISKKTKVLL